MALNLLGALRARLQFPGELCRMGRGHECWAACDKKNDEHYDRMYTKEEMNAALVPTQKIVNELAGLPLIVRGSHDEVFQKVRALQERARAVAKQKE